MTNNKDLPIEEKIKQIKERLAKIEAQENQGRKKPKAIIPSEWRLNDDKILDSVLRKFAEGGWKFKRLAESENISQDSVNKFFIRFHSLLVDDFGFESPAEVSGGRRMR